MSSSIYRKYFRTNPKNDLTKTVYGKKVVEKVEKVETLLGFV